MLTRDPASLWPSPVGDPGDLGFTVGYSTDGVCRVVRFVGDLDLLSRRVANRACLDGDHIDVVVDLTATTFMDCCGYGGLVAVRLVLEQRGGTLTLRNQAGQPARLLDLLGIVEACPTLAGAS
jgi:anti-anti-sigma factor